MSLRTFWIFCLIFVGGVFTLSFLNQRDRNTETYTPITENKPSVSFKNIDMIINSPTGQPQYKLSAPKYWLYDQEQKSEFASPNIVIYSDNGSKIYATSEEGETYNENDVITLLGNVQITQVDTHQDPSPLKIFTDKLTVLQGEQKVMTDLPVTAKRGTEKITAVGMTLNLSNKLLLLHNDVKGRYDP